MDPMCFLPVPRPSACHSPMAATRVQGRVFGLLQGGAAAGATLVFHTLHLPRLDASKADGTLAHATISRRSHVAQLNAAGRHLARRHGFQVGDQGLTWSRCSADEAPTRLDDQEWWMSEWRRQHRSVKLS